jgi:N-acetylmuramoyl-L-alanine amidase CwlA
MVPVFKDNRWAFSAETRDSAVELVKALLKKYNLLPKDVIRHYDVNRKNCPAPFAEDGMAWFEFKGFLK